MKLSKFAFAVLYNCAWRAVAKVIIVWLFDQFVIILASVLQQSLEKHIRKTHMRKQSSVNDLSSLMNR